MPHATETVAERVAALRERVDEVSLAAGREAGSVAILAVTKTHPRDAVLGALGAGLHDVGENYVQEFESKWPGVSDLAGAHFHLIGPDTDVLIDLRTLQVMRGRYTRQALAEAVAWAADNLAILWAEWRRCNERD